MRSLADGENYILFHKSHKYEDTHCLSFIRLILCDTISSKRNFKGVLDNIDGK